MSSDPFFDSFENSNLFDTSVDLNDYEMKDEQVMTLEEAQALQAPVKKSLYKLQERLLGKDLAQKCSNGGTKSLQSINTGELYQAATSNQMPLYKLLRVCQLYDLNLATGNFMLEWDPDNSFGHKDLLMGYELLNGVNEGSATVYNATNQLTNETVGVKKFFLDAYDSYNELDIATRFNHTNLLKAVDFYYDDSNRLSIVYPTSFGSLEERIQELLKVPYSYTIRLKYVCDLVNACIFLGSQGYGYLDINAKNLLIFRNDETKPMSFVNSKLVLGNLAKAYPLHVAVNNSTGPWYYLPLDHMVSVSFQGDDVTLTGPLYNNILSYKGSQDLLNKLTEGLRKAKNSHNKSSIREVEAWMLGNTILFIMTGQYLFPYDSNDLEQFIDSILSFIDQPIDYLEAKVEQIQDAFDNDKRLWLVLFSNLLSINPAKRFVEAYKVFDYPVLNPYNVIVPGYASYINLVSNVSLGLEGPQNLKYGVKQIMSYFKQNSNLVLPKQYYYETVFTAVELFYRIVSFKPLHASLNKYCDLSQLTRSCIFLALCLSWKEPLVLLEPLCPFDQLREEVRSSVVTKNIVSYLNGQLRYPYLIESCVSKHEILEILETALKRPKEFVNLLINPYKFFENQETALEAFDQAEASELLSYLVGNENIYNLPVIQELFLSNQVVKDQFQKNMYFFPEFFQEAVSSVNYALQLLNNETECQSLIKNLCWQGALVLLENILKESYIMLDNDTFLRGLWRFLYDEFVSKYSKDLPDVVEVLKRQSQDAVKTRNELTTLLRVSLKQETLDKLMESYQSKLEIIGVMWLLLLVDILRIDFKIDFEDWSRSDFDDQESMFNKLKAKKQTELKNLTIKMCKQ